MSRSLIVYFSQGGTTARIAQCIASGLRSADHGVDLFNLCSGMPPALSGYDLLGIGSPAYYFRPPFNVTDYVEDLPDLGGLLAFVFVLHGTYVGDAGNALRKTLAGKGAREVGYFRCLGADYYLPYLVEGYLLSPDHPSARETKQAEAFGRAVAKRVNGERYTKPQDDPFPGPVYRFEQFATNRWLTENLYSRLFRVNKDKCIACGQCADECPTGNISLDAAGWPVWGRRCLLCLYCEMHCPEEAITSPASWPLFLPFMKYNVHHASRDPSLDHVRVKHSQGRIERI